jgi:hypothetical protein
MCVQAGNWLRQNVRSECKIISGFHRNIDLDLRFTNQSVLFSNRCILRWRPGMGSLYCLRICNITLAAGGDTLPDRNCIPAPARDTSPGGNCVTAAGSNTVPGRNCNPAAGSDTMQGQNCVTAAGSVQFRAGTCQ